MLRDKGNTVRASATITQSLRAQNPGIRVANSIYDPADRPAFAHDAVSIAAPSDLEFEFDDVIINSQAYRRAMAHAQANIPPSSSQEESVREAAPSNSQGGPIKGTQDSRLLASSSDDTTVKIWESATGRCISTLQGHTSPVCSVAWSRDRTRLASGSIDKRVKIWDLATGQCVSTLKGHTDWVRSVAWSQDMTQLASGSDNNTVKIWDSATSGCVLTLNGHTSQV